MYNVYDVFPVIQENEWTTNLKLQSQLHKHNRKINDRIKQHFVVQKSTLGS